MERLLTPPLEAARRAIVTCTRCSRLRRYCQNIAIQKRAAYRDDDYWARPVPGFGDPQARIVLVGLAPAAHGANRTGRMFTGDGTGGSGDFLMTALHATGLASQPFSRSRDDGLTLRDAWIVAAARCAPPDNKPTPEEIANCRVHLDAEISALTQARVFVALGQVAFAVCWRHLEGRGIRLRPRPGFGHGAEVITGGVAVLASYHPSRQNTNTGRLTPPMLRAVFARARLLADRLASR
jgi:uracil-DNA glycosylase family 4